MSEESSSKQEVTKKEQPQNPKQSQSQDLNELITAIIPLAKEYIDFKKTEFQARDKRILSIGQHNRHLTYSLLLFLVAIVTLTGILTLYGKVSGDALLFLAGTITGYMIVWVQDLIFAPTDQVSDDS